ncbi:MAG: hypothetical protein GY943_16610 [Chloroflexi bacterium]|nr:hypothetical protein [Chloroflexota bacterium]
MTRYRVPLYILIGLVIGIGLGLYVGWVTWPTEFTDANPAVLQATYQQDYVQLIADAYASDHDLSMAQSRLQDISSNGETVLLDVLTNKVLAEADESEIQRLVQLAHDLGLSSPAMAPFLSGEPTP